MAKCGRSLSRAYLPTAQERIALAPGRPRQADHIASCEDKLIRSKTDVWDADLDPNR